MKRYAALLPLVAAPTLLAALALPVDDEASPAPDPAPAAAAADPAAGTARPKIQVALLLDNSGSMSGLLDQARSELWTIVGTLAEAKHGGRAPVVEVALYAYGNPTKAALVPFTTDLDRVSEALFALGIDGGDEWCGATIDLALDQLAWSADPDALKLLYIAGNEPFTQGPVRWQDAIEKAKRANVVVNTIHCGGSDDGWRSAAVLAGGTAATIDHNARVAQIATPYDHEIARLGAALNDTYVPYGARGGESAARQIAQDKNALGLGASTASKRMAAKASKAYSNAEWDLVDAVKEGKVAAEKLSDEDRKKVEAAQAKRAELQAKLADLSKQRAAFEAAEKKKQAAAPSTLDRALLDGLAAPAKAKGFALSN